MMRKYPYKSRCVCFNMVLARNMFKKVEEENKKGGNEWEEERG